MTNSSTRWLLVAAALLGLALLLPVVSAHGGLGVFNPSDDTARDISPRSDNHHMPMMGDRSAVTDGDRSGHGLPDRGHHHGPWMNETHSGEWANGTYSGEWANETYGPHGPMHHGQWVNDTYHNGTYSSEWANETYGPHGPHGPWMNHTYHNGTYSGEWANETYGPHGPMHHGQWVNDTHYDQWTNGTDAGEWTNETYGPHGPWVNESQADDVWTDDTDGSNTRNGGHHRGPGGCR